VHNCILDSKLPAIVIASPPLVDEATSTSSDRRLRKAARARKAISVKSEVFWNNIQKQLSRKKTIKEPAAKRQGLTDGETKQWLEFFGLEQ
jgi:hypothetical protein